MEPIHEGSQLHDHHRNVMKADTIVPMNASPTVDDIKTLGDGEDINDEIIRAVLGLKINEIKTTRNFRVLDPSHFSRHLRDALGLKQINSGWQCMLTPLHHDGRYYRHWTLISVDFEEGFCTHMDSIFDSERDDRTMTRILAFLQVSGCSRDWTWDKATVAQQSGDDNNCAIHVMVKATALLAGKPLPDKVAGLEMRVEYAGYLYAAFWKNYCEANAV